MAQVLEMAPIRLAPGRTEADLIAASERFQEAFLARQPGYLRRYLVRGAAGEFHDLVFWESDAAAAAIMEKAMSSEECAAYFAVMDMAGDVTESVRHLSILTSDG